MADDDLAAIRQRRMAELQQQYGGGGSSGDDAAKKEEMKAKEDEMRNNFLSQFLSQPARARLNTLAAAKPEKAKIVENYLFSMARAGQIQGKLGEDELKAVLENVSERTQKKTTVKFDRRRNLMEDDDF